MKDFDLADLLRAWPYDPDVNVRVAKCPDGRDVLQVRQPLGIEQYEMDGRPDGLRPHGAESLLEHHLLQLEEAKQRAAQAKFSLPREEAVELINEGTLYYFRYVHLFQIRDWARTARDTARNIRMFDLVAQYCDDRSDSEGLEQWRPYIIRMNAVARAMMGVDNGEHCAALDIVAEAIDTIEGLPDLADNATFQAELERSLEVLNSLADDIERNRPVSDVERLQRELRKAVDGEEYERAATLRDKIRAHKRASG